MRDTDGITLSLQTIESNFKRLRADGPNNVDMALRAQTFGKLSTAKALVKELSKKYEELRKLVEHNFGKDDCPPPLT